MEDSGKSIVECTLNRTASMMAVKKVRESKHKSAANRKSVIQSSTQSDNYTNDPRSDSTPET
jgi:hypothetical protein